MEYAMAGIEEIATRIGYHFQGGDLFNASHAWQRMWRMAGIEEIANLEMVTNPGGYLFNASHGWH